MSDSAQMNGESQAGMLPVDPIAVQAFVNAMAEGIEDARVDKILAGMQVAASLDPNVTQSDIAAAALSMLARWLFANFANDHMQMQIAMTAIGASLLRGIEDARKQSGDGGSGVGVMVADPGVIRADGSTEGNVG